MSDSLYHSHAFGFVACRGGNARLISASPVWIVRAYRLPARYRHNGRHASDSVRDFDSPIYDGNGPWTTRRRKDAKKSKLGGLIEPKIAQIHANLHHSNFFDSRSGSRPRQLATQAVPCATFSTPKPESTPFSTLPPNEITSTPSSRTTKSTASSWKRAALHGGSPFRCNALF